MAGAARFFFLVAVDADDAGAATTCEEGTTAAVSLPFVNETAELFII